MNYGFDSTAAMRYQIILIELKINSSQIEKLFIEQKATDTPPNEFRGLLLNTHNKLLKFVIQTFSNL